MLPLLVHSMQVMASITQHDYCFEVAISCTWCDVLDQMHIAGGVKVASAGVLQVTGHRQGTHNKGIASISHLSSAFS